MGRYQIGLETIDEEFADSFKHCLNNVYRLNPSKSKISEPQQNWNNKHCVRLCCKAACDDLLSYGVSFKQNEWLVPEAIKNASKVIQANYLKGFFDSEGSVDIDGRKIKGTSTRLPGLQENSTLLTDLKIKSGIVSQSKKKNRKKAYDLVIQGRKHIETFGKRIGFNIARKDKKLHTLLSNYKYWITPKEKVSKLEPKMKRLRSLGLTYKEISGKLDLSISTVWFHLNK